MRPVLTLFGRDYCHLCHEMETALEAIQVALADITPFDFEAVDVDEREEWVEKYDEKVPVLVAGDRELCHYHLDVSAVRSYLAETVRIR